MESHSTGERRPVIVWIALAAILVAVIAGGAFLLFTKSFTRFKTYTPEGEDAITLAFPGPPSWVDQPVQLIKFGVPGKSSIRLFCHETDSEMFALHVKKLS